MLQMSSMVREAGLGPGFGGAGGPGLFGAQPGANASANPSGAGTTPFNPSQWPPFPQPGQGGGANTGATAAGTATGTPSTTSGTGAGAAGAGAGFNNPMLLQQLLSGLGAGTPGGMHPGLGLGGFGAPTQPTQPADTRSPEERYQHQLQQLQEMGFTNASQNVRALLATGGNVHSAIEYILNGGGV